MEEKRLSEAIHGAVFNRNIRRYKEIKDFYQDAIADVDISNIYIDVINEDIEVFEWILEHPEYNYKSFDFLEVYDYTNEELNQYFKVYYEDLIFTLNKFNKQEFVIKLEDFE